MEVLNAALRGLVSALLYPFGGLHPLIGLTVISLVVAILMLLVFKVTSNQDGLADVKRKIHASLFEMRLFNADLGALLRAQGDLLKSNLRYLGYSLVPMLWMIVPFVLLVGQLHYHYGFEPVRPGQPVLVEADLAEGWQDGVEAEDVRGFTKPVAHLTASDGVRVETPALWAPELSELSWRVVAEEPGEYELAIDVAGERYTKILYAGDRLDTRKLLSPIRTAPDFLTQLLYPAEPPLSDGPLQEIRVSYQDADVWFFGWNTHWMIIFFILTSAFAFLLRNRFGVTL
jgi:uncharacterized membrane protein (DUF106 family)